MLEGYSKNQACKIIMESTPASASTYSSKFLTNLRSNNRAVGLERIMYCCPNCKKLCTLYSEFSCIKCKNCGSAFEINNDGQLLFSRNISSFDEIKNFQFTALKSSDFSINEIVTYDKITQIIPQNTKKTIKINVVMQIYADKLTITNPLTNIKKDIFLDSIDNIEFTYNNNIKIILNNAKELYFCGNNNENFLIINDLVLINKN
jgi:hypothetical protein